MPRSKKQINADRAAKQRCWRIIKEATSGYTGNLDATSIVGRIQWHYAKDIEADKPLVRYLWGKGLAREVREALDEWGLISHGEEEAPPQLELFREDERNLVTKLGRARIWLPSANNGRGAHVQYHDLPPARLRESAAYYIRHGRGEMTFGERLNQLASLREGPSQQAA
jgi:hypothetical protein